MRRQLKFWRTKYPLWNAVIHEIKKVVGYFPAYAEVVNFDAGDVYVCKNKLLLPPNAPRYVDSLEGLLDIPWIEGRKSGPAELEINVYNRAQNANSPYRKRNPESVVIIFLLKGRIYRVMKRGARGIAAVRAKLAKLVNPEDC